MRTGRCGAPAPPPPVASTPSRSCVTWATDAPKATARFLQERGILLRLRHENLVAVHDLLTTADGRLALVLDLVSGGTLRELLRQRGSLPAAEAAELLAQVADGLAAAHGKAVVHRDLKPDNVLLAPRMDGGIRLRLTDFGIARVLDGPRMTTSGAVLGTPNYMAPEVIEGSPATPAADVYGLGIILYELLAGRPPFDGDGVDTAILVRHTRATALPLAGMAPRVWALIEACLDRDPAQRPDAKTLRTTLRRLAAETVGVEAIRPVRKGDRRPTFLLTDIGGGGGGRSPAHRRRPGVRTASAVRPARPDRPRRRPGQGPGPAIPNHRLVASRSGRPPRGRYTGVPPRRRHRTVTAAFAAVIAVAWRSAATSACGTPPADTRSTTADRDRSAGTSVRRDRLERARPPAPAAGSPAAAGRGRCTVCRGRGPDPGTHPRERPRRQREPGARRRDAGGLSGEWQCTEERCGRSATRWSAQACHALGAAAVRVKGIFSGISGVKANIEVAVENVNTGATVAGPFRCPDRRFTDSVKKHTCGPYTVSLPRGRYRVVGRWVYTDTDNLAPPGSVVGSPFDW